MIEKRSPKYDCINKVIDLLKHGDISSRAVWLIYFAAKQRLMVGKVRKKH